MKKVKILFMLILVVLFVSNYSLSQEWVVVPSPSPSSTRNILRGVGSISSNDVWAVGVSGEQPSFTLTEHWNGVNWTVISSPNHGVQYNELYAVQGLSSNNVYAVGYYSVIGTPQMYVLHWDGTSWTEQTTPTVTGGSGLESIVIFGPDDIYAGGFKSVGVPGPSIGTLVLHWNGSSWNIETTPNQSDNRHNFITDMKGLSANDIWAVGYSRRITENYQAMVLHKTGSDWNIVPVPQHPGAENFLYSIDIIAPDNIWAAGEYNDGSNYSPYFFHYNGSNWSIVNSAGGGSGIVNHSANDIWSSGFPFAHYDGTTWNVVNTPIPTSGTIGTMARISSTDIWTVGRYIDGEIMKTLTMHYGYSVPVELTAFEVIVPEKFELSQNYPNPFNPSTKIKYQIATSNPVSLKIYDVLGNEVASLVDEVQPSGNYEVTFDASSLSSGTYFYKLQAGSLVETRKMVLTR